MLFLPAEVRAAVRRALVASNIFEVNFILPLFQFCAVLLKEKVSQFFLPLHQTKFLPCLRAMVTMLCQMEPYRKNTDNCFLEMSTLERVLACHTCHRRTPFTSKASLH
jgi:hypothetical protein